MPLVGTSSVPTVDLIEVSGKQGMDVWYGDVRTDEDATRKGRCLLIMPLLVVCALQNFVLLYLSSSRHLVDYSCHLIFKVKS